MEALIETEQVEIIRIEETEVILKELGEDRGKVIVSNADRSYSYFWGAMGGTLKQFLCEINEDYFTDKLMGARSTQVMDVKKTFAEVRKHIREELRLPWYEHQEFQKDMRERLKSFQRQCEETPVDRFFVDHFYNFIKSLDFYLIEQRYDQERMEEAFNEITEPWHFFAETDSPDCLWLKDLHRKIKKAIKLNLK
jgi:hypothetical protein